MTRILGFASAALFALSVSTASAQPPPPQDPTGGRGVGGGSTTGGESTPASPSPSSSGTSSSSSSGSATPMSSGGGSSSGMSSGSWGEGRTIEGPRMAAPRRGSSYSEDGGGQRERAVPRGGGSSGGGERATPRGGSSDRGDSGGARERAVPRGESGERMGGRSGVAATPPVDDQPGRNRGSAIPAYSRPREGRAVVGTPIERSEATRIRDGGSAWYYDPYWSGGYGYSGYGYGYRPYRSYGYPGYGFGLGYFYDPFMFGSIWGDPYYGGYASYGGYYGGGGAGYYQGRGATGSLRLKIRPADAKVYIDGYFVGVVDSFDGVFQKLAVEPGTHRVEIRADGFEPVQFEVLINATETVTYKGDLKRIIP